MPLRIRCGPGMSPATAAAATAKANCAMKMEGKQHDHCHHNKHYHYGGSGQIWLDFFHILPFFWPFLVFDLLAIYFVIVVLIRFRQNRTPAQAGR